VPVLSMAALLTTVFSGPALSQRLTGNMTGRVLDWNGDPVQDAEVTINSPAMITQNVTATSNERGEFRFANLEPGVYEVRGELSGFGTMLHQNVRVTVGATTELTLELQPQMGELLVVTAEPPTVDTTSTTSGANYTREILENVPNTRSIRDVFNYTPAVTGSSARGSTVRGNAWRYDAVDVSDPTIGTQLVAFNYDTLDEIQVQTGGHPAEFGQATGALVNVVTKSGGNNLSGEVNLYFQNDHLTSTNGEEITERFPDLQPATLTKRVDTQFQLGGPIVPNEIWFFGAYRYLDTDREVVGFNDESGNPIPTKFNEQFALFKVPAQLGPNHKIVGGIHWSSFTADHRGADALTPPQSTEEVTEAVWVPNLEWTGIFNQTTFGQVRFTVVDNNLDFFPKNDEPSCFNLDTGVEPCSAGIEDLNKRDRRQLTASLSHFRELGGTHDFKFGFEFEDSDSWRDFTANQGLAFQTVGNDVPFLAFTGVQDPPTKEAINRLSFYAQDSWAVSERLTLNLGVRVDSNEGWFPEQELASGETQPEMRDIVSQTDVSPRIGIAYAIGGLGKGVIRASFSRYVDALTIQNFFRVNGNAISGQVRAVCAGPLGFLCVPGDGEFSSQILSEFGASNTELDAGLRLPKADEFAVGFEIALGSAMAFGVNYVDKSRPGTSFPEPRMTRETPRWTKRETCGVKILLRRSRSSTQTSTLPRCFSSPIPI
jgi:hypothetical protein